MTTFTDSNGSRTVVCDHCRCDIPNDSLVFALYPSTVKDGYASREFDKGEMIFCNDCTGAVGQVLNLMRVKRARRLAHLQQAA